MSTLNEVRLIGRLTRDPVLRQTMSGHSIADFGLATSRKYKDSAGTQKEETTFVDCSCWGKLAEIVNNNLGKGRLVFVGGRLKFDSWDDKTTGAKRSKLSVTAENVQFLDWPKDSEQAPAYSPKQGGRNINNPNDWQPPSGVTAGMKTGNEWDKPDMDEPPF